MRMSGCCAFRRRYCCIIGVWASGLFIGLRIRPPCSGRSPARASSDLAWAFVRERKPGVRCFREISAAPPRERDARRAFRFVEQHVPDQSMRSCFGRHARQEADTDPGSHQLKYEIDLARARRNLRRQSLAPASVDDYLVQREAFVEQDEWKRRKLFQSDGLLLRGCVTRGQQHNERLAAHVLPIEILRNRMQQRGEVESAAPQGIFQLLAVMHSQAYLDARIEAPERREHRSEQGAAAEAR